jgi:alginate O-acetyltransferase complex protein AlgI
MLFNSYAFIFLFLPISVFVFFLFGRCSPAFGAIWLAAASLFFYGFWDWHNTFLLVTSILVNYFCGIWLANLARKGAIRASRLVLFAAVAANLACLGYYKYSGFFFGSLAESLGASTTWISTMLPLGVSFFTFTQIAFLVDVARGKALEPRLDHYFLFVTYFPHLIAGPILHHAEIMPQFAHESTYKPRAAALAIGATIFVIGLFKKVVIADPLGDIGDPIFSLALRYTPTTTEAWAGVLAYTFQIYFDFSAYMDMAVGLSLLFNIKLPANFNSPYKSLSIIDFWRRWHITLSRFLRDYLYIPLGGNRGGTATRFTNLMITMLLGGLWHGAGWTFVVWGGLHGVYLVTNHAWRSARARFLGRMAPSKAGALLSWALAFLAVVIAWVFFRAPDMQSAVVLLKSMAGLNGTYLPAGWLDLLRPAAPFLARHDIHFGDAVSTRQLGWVSAAFVIAMFMPNVRQLFRNYQITLPPEREGSVEAATPRLVALLAWRPSVVWAGVIVGCFLFSISIMTKVSQFLYFQF